MRSVLASLIILLCFISCEVKSKTPTAKPQDFDHKVYTEELKKAPKPIEKKKPIAKAEKTEEVETEIEPNIPEKKNPIQISSKADTIHFSIHYGKAKIDTIKTAGRQIVFVFDADTASKMNLKITPIDSLANFRISQIIDSEGNSDGPFGREIQYPIEGRGVQKVRVGESLMQGDAWGGRFTFEVSLGW